MWPHLHAPFPARCQEGKLRGHEAAWCGWGPGTFTGGRAACADSGRHGSAASGLPSRTAPRSRHRPGTSGLAPHLPVGQRLASSPRRGGGCGQRAERVLTWHYPPVAREAPAPRGRRRREQPATPTPASSAGFLRVWPRGVSAFGGRGRARLPHPLVTESIPVPHLWLGSQARRVSPPVGPAEEAEEALGVGGGPWVWVGGTTLPDRPW